MITIPEILKQIDYTNKPLDYKWDENKSERFLSQQVINKKLLNEIAKLNYKATFGFASAAYEWICWRFLNWRPKNSGKAMDVSFQAVEAHWVGLIDKYYLRLWSNGAVYKELPEDGIERPLWMAQNLMSDARFNYAKTRPTLYGNATRLLTLARYLSTEETLFDSWLKDCLDRAEKLFPNKQWPIGEEISRDNMDENYDSNNDPFIPRKFFFIEGFNYQLTDLRKMQQDLIGQADYMDNMLLSKPEKMIEEGFQGTPYKYEPK